MCLYRMGSRSNESEKLMSGWGHEFATADALFDEVGEFVARRIHRLVAPCVAEFGVAGGVGDQVRPEATLEFGAGGWRLVGKDGDHVLTGVAGVKGGTIAEAVQVGHGFEEEGFLVMPVV